MHMYTWGSRGPQRHAQAAGRALPDLGARGQEALELPRTAARPSKRGLLIGKSQVPFKGAPLKGL